MIDLFPWQYQLNFSPKRQNAGGRKICEYPLMTKL